jgi:Flp pilus assembly CpaF family ATPase
MRPDRIVVGEVRGAEAFELTRAVNAGCGFLCTVQRNSAPDALNTPRRRVGSSCHTMHERWKCVRVTSGTDRQCRHAR